MMRIDQLVTIWAEHESQHLALVGQKSKLTYGDLDTLANQFAHSLINQGVGIGDRVGIHSPRSPIVVAAMLGVLRAGAAFVPIDPASPISRAILIANDCNLHHLITTSSLLKVWQEAKQENKINRFLLIDNHDHSTSKVTNLNQIKQHSNNIPSVSTNCSDDLAFILYTSGSTGTPKGVMISHRNVLAFTEWAATLVDLNNHDHVANHAPFHFDLSVFDIWASFSRGATIFIVDEAISNSGHHMSEFIRHYNITIWYSVPSALMLMLDSGELTRNGAASLRVICFAGEVFPLKHLRRLMTAVRQARFFNFFGPTETNVCLYYEIKKPPSENSAAIPIGWPSCSNTISIVSTSGHPVADGEIGELLVDGPTVMLGYFNGGNTIKPQRPYPTGDLVSRGANGELWYHGRLDHMVKIRGNRIELGEVEAVLNQHPKVHEAVALVAHNKLIAVAVPNEQTLSVLDLKRHCAGLLPRYMIPSDVRLVRKLPRTDNGKADRLSIGSAVAGMNPDLLIPARDKNRLGRSS
ncbi:MAG: amino acid adenylation domain-containing protein [Deltaproteobacteria bacterium]|nr:amino acid adenylation domain-containing protein [Deltaproteobacteria bacterium]